MVTNSMALISKALIIYRWGTVLLKIDQEIEKKTLDLKLHTGIQPSLVYYTIHTVARLLFRFYVSVYKHVENKVCICVRIHLHIIFH